MFWKNNTETVIAILRTVYTRVTNTGMCSKIIMNIGTMCNVTITIH